MFYRYFSGRGRKALAGTLDAADPFGVSPADIVERVLALGYVPDVAAHRYEMFPTIGPVYQVRRKGQDFLVAIGRDAEEISVQEMRADAYMPVE